MGKNGDGLGGGTEGVYRRKESRVFHQDPLEWEQRVRRGCSW